ncbi:hypothetical protein GCM10028796_32040 [Ramlibacter monticola]
MRGSRPTDALARAWNTMLSMKLFLQSAIVFFGTLLAAALVALGAPGNAEVEMASQGSSATVVALLGLEE